MAVWQGYEVLRHGTPGTQGFSAILLQDGQEVSPLHDIPLRAASDGLGGGRGEPSGQQSGEQGEGEKGMGSGAHTHLTHTHTHFNFVCLNPAGRQIPSILSKSGNKVIAKPPEAYAGVPQSRSFPWNVGILPQTHRAPAGLPMGPIEAIDISPLLRGIGSVYLVKPLAVVAISHATLADVSYHVVVTALKHRPGEDAVMECLQEVCAWLDSVHPWLSSGLHQSESSIDATLDVKEVRKVLSKAHRNWAAKFRPGSKKAASPFSRSSFSVSDSECAPRRAANGSRGGAAGPGESGGGVGGGGRGRGGQSEGVPVSHWLQRSRSNETEREKGGGNGQEEEEAEGENRELGRPLLGAESGEGESRAQERPMMSRQWTSQIQGRQQMGRSMVRSSSANARVAALRSPVGWAPPRGGPGSEEPSGLPRSPVSCAMTSKLNPGSPSANGVPMGCPGSAKGVSSPSFPSSPSQPPSLAAMDEWNARHMSKGVRWHPPSGLRSPSTPASGSASPSGVGSPSGLGPPSALGSPFGPGSPCESVGTPNSIGSSSPLNPKLWSNPASSGHTAGIPRPGKLSHRAFTRARSETFSRKQPGEGRVGGGGGPDTSPGVPKASRFFVRTRSVVQERTAGEAGPNSSPIQTLPHGTVGSPGWSQQQQEGEDVDEDGDSDGDVPVLQPSPLVHLGRAAVLPVAPPVDPPVSYLHRSITIATARAAQMPVQQPVSLAGDTGASVRRQLLEERSERKEQGLQQQEGVDGSGAAGGGPEEAILERQHTWAASSPSLAAHSSPRQTTQVPPRPRILSKNPSPRMQRLTSPTSQPKGPAEEDAQAGEKRESRVPLIMHKLFKLGTGSAANSSAR